jgi:hypothetical protein
VPAGVRTGVTGFAVRYPDRKGIIEEGDKMGSARGHWLAEEFGRALGSDNSTVYRCMNAKWAFGD